MRRIIAGLLFAITLISVPEASAQVFIGHSRGGISFGISIGRARGCYFGPRPGFGGFVNPYEPFPPVVIAQPPVIVAPVPIVIQIPQPQPQPVIQLGGGPAQADARQFDEDNFFVIRPRPQGAEPAGPRRPPLPLARPNPRPLEAEPGLPPRRPLAVQPEPEANPQRESERLSKLGRDAFADGLYGLAIERFRRAIKLSPDNAEAYFDLSQAYFAVGKYRQAVATIAEGLKHDADWPDRRFDPRVLYGPNQAEFIAHLGDLRTLLAADPNDPGLLFLLGHQLWFSGDRVGAEAVFRKAANRATDPTMIDEFLKRLEDGRLVRR